MNSSSFRFIKAELRNAEIVWKILQQAILRRKNDGSRQWQDGYPNFETINSDIEKGNGYVLIYDEKVIGYSAVIFNDEPAYETIEGKWLSDGDFVVVHRVAVSDDYVGKKLSKTIFSYIETLALENSVFSIKVDTNFDNPAMLKTLENLGYTYCGEVYFRGNARKAFEKLLK